MHCTASKIPSPTAQTLLFRIQLDGHLDEIYGGNKGEIPLHVEAVFEDGTLVERQDEVLEVIGCTEKPNAPPALYLTSKLGGVSYRLKIVSKRMDDRKVCVRVTLGNGAPVASITSHGTLVFSKRKNKDHREQQQLQERLAMEKREEEAVHNIMANKRARLESAAVVVPVDHQQQVAALEQELDEMKQRVHVLEKQVHEQQSMLQLYATGATACIMKPQASNWLLPAAPELRRDTSLGYVAPNMLQLSRETSMELSYPPSKLMRETSLEFFPTKAENILLQLKREVSQEHSVFDGLSV